MEEEEEEQEQEEGQYDKDEGDKSHFRPESVGAAWWSTSCC